MHQAVARATLFPLVIEVNFMDLGWSRFLGAQGTTHILDDLPNLSPKTRARIDALVTLLRQQGTRSIELSPDRFPVVYLNEHLSQPPRMEQDDTNEVLKLIAWWIEWTRRTRITGSSWDCPDCSQTVTREQGHCGNSTCASWDMLYFLTGEPTLHLVPQTGTHDS